MDVSILAVINTPMKGLLNAGNLMDLFANCIQMG